MTRRRFLQIGVALIGWIGFSPTSLLGSLTPLGPRRERFALPLGGDPIHGADWPYAPPELDPFEALRFRLIYHGLPERERAKQIAAERR